MLQWLHYTELQLTNENFNFTLFLLIRKEVSRIRKASFLKAINLALYFSASKFVNFLSFMAFFLTGGKLYPKMVFITMSLFNLLRLHLTLLLPLSIEVTANAWVSCRRIQKFLLLDEIEAIENSSSNEEIVEKEENERVAIKVENVTAKLGKVGF